MRYIFIFLLSFFLANAQEKIVGTFDFYNQKVNYTTYNYKDRIYPVNKFFIFINQDENVVKCLKNKHVKPFFLTIPATIPKDKYEQLFLEFYIYITNRTKLIDSYMYVIADKKYTRLYEEQLKKEKQSSGEFTHNIKNEYLNLNVNEICNLLKTQ
ncbi:hypothetical protein CHU92_00235 [Flavobacterium cyanobacteriorum]|uniref:DUF4369 domain-containing protein n=1 Tax=Flavobacterium cyanobacteriorum TaxID=2022802 RepID=A0A256A876_9FLAO|nr:hypothetical protein [Flavobacterium cyanobacteriorum]OYQ49906.1 hypothetical protein CHU92_00235 [Flavobacterium cyanobacteriorum]